MQHYALIVITFLPTAVMAHDGFHVHPHGMELAWVLAAVIGVVAGCVIARVRR